ncbi:MAG: DUF4132 domain-containing protein [Planctomycetaceae bacterium]|nr:DUF4132 domain-containing protein [Planctomycetaceae bacterium]
MLKPDQAKARLAEWQLPEDENRLADGVKQLPAALGELAEVVFNLNEDEEDNVDWQVQQKRHQQAILRFDRLTAKERAQVFSLVSPKIAPAMEAAWQLLKTIPYQTGYSGKAFRAPRNPELAADNLSGFMNSMGKLGRRFRPDTLTPAWLAAWVPHIEADYQPVDAAVGKLLAAILNRPGAEADEIFEILRQSLSNQHEIGAPGGHVYTALLLSNRQEGWELMEKALLAAQRQEGLRQAILEAVDVAHPEAFRRIVRLILEHDLARFSSVIRAVDVWFGDLWAAASGGVVKKMLTQLVAFLEDPAARAKALGGKDPEAIFLALWCAATEDAFASVPLAEKLLSAKSVEMRYVAARHLANLDLDVASVALIPALDDEDLRVAILAIPEGSYQSDQPLPGLKTDDRFERLERLVERVTDKPQKLKPLVWPWTELRVMRSQVADCLLGTLGKRPATRLIPHLSKLDSYTRNTAVGLIVAAKPWNDATRQAVINLAGDTVADVRETAFKALLNETLTAAEVQRLESYLARKTGDLRRGVLALLLKQDDAAALASAGRLLAAKDGNQRLAGLELLRLLTDAKRSVAECRRLAAAYQAARKKVTKEEQSHLDEIAADRAAVATLDDALGLMNPADRTPVVAPRNLKVPMITPAAVACLKSLDDLVHEHRQTSIKYKSYVGEQEELLGSITWGFPSPNFSKPREKQRDNLPLTDVWLKWSQERGKALRDKDGLELVRAQIWASLSDSWEGEDWTRWAKKSPARKSATSTLSGGQTFVKLRYGEVVGEIIDWLLFLAPLDARDYWLDAIETSFSLVPEADMALLGQPKKEDSYGEEDEQDWRAAKAFELWPEHWSKVVQIAGQDPAPQQQARLWRLMHWRDQPFAGARRRRVGIDLLLAAYDQGAANLADIADHLLAPRGEGTYSNEDFGLLSTLTERKHSKDMEAWLTRHPEVRELGERAVARILELELTRGDSPTAAALPAHAINTLYGVETLRRILHALGKAEFKLGHAWRDTGKQDRRQTLTKLAQVAFPADGETPEDFARQMKAAVREGQFPEERLMQLTFLAPQWTRSVEAYLGWEQMSEGVYWFLAHMRYVSGLAETAAAAAGAEDDAATEEVADSEDAEEVDDDDSSDGEAPPKPRKLSAWERLILERTPLTDTERNEGAIDVAWFRRTHEQLGDKRWQALAAAARFAANASQAKRAQFIADVLLDKITRKELIDGIKKKQLKDHVRLLGLLPLASGKKREADLVERCQVLREYRRYANQLSGLTKPAALRAWDIGMKNMAQTAGFADPLRLEWAVGAEAVKDLAKGPVAVSKSGVTVTLSLDELSKPSIAVSKGDKELKSIPPAIKKDKKVAELTARVTDLKRQASAIRQSLEAAMCRGDTFTGGELRQWCGHALLAPLLTRLVVIGEGIAGYPDKGGKALRDHAGKLEPVKTNETLRLAHAHDLLAGNAWQDWQRACFRSERVQPFKQVFRELYVLTSQEKKDGAVSHRYDGQQVQPKQALALFGSRGWNTQDGIFKIFHDLQLTANVNFQSGVTTPLEVEGWTLAGVTFTKRDEWKPTALASVPPRLFSEVMRDLDLVVSVAHAGGVDPEASASTVEMRAGLLRETCSLLALKNVQLKPSHAVIDGELANYSVHLGSGVVHKLPGGSLCIVPVHAQHRGRLFLPFADDDPRTAEVVSKVLLLSRDHEIQDPTILEQIRR